MNIDEFESFEYRTEKENAIYEKTKNFGRTQFVREIALQIKENQYLKERVAYLERSNNRREETILYLRDENIELSDKIDELRSWLQDEIIDSKAGGSQYYWFGRVLSKLNELEGGKNE